MPRVQVISTVQSGGGTHRAGTFVDMSDEELKAMPAGSVRVMANETEEKSRKAILANENASGIDARLAGKVFSGMSHADPPWAQPSDSPIDVIDPETGRPYPDDHAEAREAKDKSIIERQAKADLRHPNVQLAIQPEEVGGAKGDKNASKAQHEAQKSARESFDAKAKAATPAPEHVLAGGAGALTPGSVVTTTPTPDGPKPPEKGETVAKK
jgi:hypothetical protein